MQKILNNLIKANKCFWGFRYIFQIFAFRNFFRYFCKKFFKVYNEYLLKVEIFEGEVNFDDAGGLHPRPEDVLLSWLVVLRTQPVQVVQEAGSRYIYNPV